MRTLTLNLKGEYFDQIKAGAKTEEYRLCKPFWAKRLEGRQYDQVVILKGYPPKDDITRRLVFPWNGFAVKTITHCHFGSEPVTVYAIKVEAGAISGHKQLTLF